MIHLYKIYRGHFSVYVERKMYCKVHLSKKYKGYKNELEKWRLKQWEKIGDKTPENYTNSLKTTDNNANSYSTEQGSGYNDGAI